MKAALGWRRALVLTHRWLGIGGGLLFVMWFATGIVMVYHRMPELDAEERLRALEPLALGSVAIGPAEAATAAGAGRTGGGGEGVRIEMLLGRPVYRFATATVWADTGEPVAPLGASGALAVVASARPEHAGTLRHEGLVDRPDQWTLQNRAQLPLHRIALGDDAGTRLYVSDRTGELAMETTRSERRWAWAGAVLHWLYFTPLRARPGLWTETIIWLSVAGCVLTLSGLAWGLVRWSPRRRQRAGGVPAASPYVGLLRWHHYAGLLFGLFSLTWILSGLLSMDPWSWHPGTAATREQRDGVAGPPVGLEMGAERVRAAAAALEGELPARQLRLVRFRGTPYFLATGAAPGDRRLVPALADDPRAFVRLADADLLEAAARAMPGHAILEATRLEAYDAYYYDRSGAAPLPVLRVRYGDPVHTWLYLDPGSGTIVRKEERLTRLNRWLYHGLHSLDLPVLYASRPLWDLVVVVLSLGGLVLAATTLLPGWRRVVRVLRR